MNRRNIESDENTKDTYISAAKRQWSRVIEPVPVRSKRASTGSIAFLWSHRDPSMYRRGELDNRGTVHVEVWRFRSTKVSLPVRGIETRPRRIIAKIGTIFVAAVARDYGTSTSRHDGVVYADRASAPATNAHTHAYRVFNWQCLLVDIACTNDTKLGTRTWRAPLGIIRESSPGRYPHHSMIQLHYDFLVSRIEIYSLHDVSR